MNLVGNLSSIFSDTFSNLENGPGLELQDINEALLTAINTHISQPAGNASFAPVGFGVTWNSSYSVSGLPTNILRSHGVYINPLMRPILADAVAFQINSLAPLAAASPPPVAQAAVPVLLAALGRATGLAAPGAPAISSALTTANTAANATPAGLVALPAAVSAAIVGLAGLVTADRLSDIPYAELVNTLDFELQNIGISGIGLRPASWAAVKGQVLAIPKNPALLGSLGARFWQAILFTVEQAVPGVIST